MVSTDPEQYPEGIEPEVQLPLGRRPLYEYLEHHADERPDEIALNFYGRTLSFAELNDAVDAFASYLADRGYGKGDTILLFLQNCPQFYVGYHAAHKLGMKVSPCNPMSKEHRVEYQLNDADVGVVLTLASFGDIIANVWDETALEDAVYTRLDRYLPEEPVPAIHDEMGELIAATPDELPTDGEFLADVLDDHAGESAPDVDHDMDDVCLLQYTSGTTGLPKGCMHTYETILHKAGTNATLYNFDEEDVHFGVMPVFHVAGKLNTVDTPLVGGGATALLTRYEPEAVMEVAERYRPTHFWLTTPMVREVLDHPDRDTYDLTSFEYNPVSSFGEGLTQELADRWHEVTGAEIAEGAYGLSETHTKDTFTRKLGIVEEGFVGLPAHDVDIVIRDWETHEEVPRGEIGEISVKSPSVMEGYWEKPEKTAETMYEGYVLTGDIGRMTEDGYLYFLGRRKSMIKSSGYSVSPTEVEKILKTHDGINNAAVFGRNHETRGEEVIAVVTLVDDGLTADEIVSWGAENMAAYKRPREVIIRNEMPLTDMGKLDKQALKEEVL
ncbi:AMP-binding protein [Natrinema sp. 74]|uniref:AMP-binding protein n=1 Tax=Natrinema sp. 74 TaxID=3384159 RepID=UPI0038D43E0A